MRIQRLQECRRTDDNLFPASQPDRSTEDFSYFTLRREADVVSNAATNPHEGSDESESNSVTEEYASTPGSNSSKEGASRETSLFGISCVRQIETSMLLKCPPDVTRSSVQKAIVVIGDEPRYLGQLREKLSVVTLAWFSQRYVLRGRWSPCLDGGKRKEKSSKIGLIRLACGLRDEGIFQTSTS